MEPLNAVLEQDIYYNRERDNNDVEQEVINEILNSDTIQTGYNCLIIEHPE